MKIENVKTIKIRIEDFDQFEFHYEELANVQFQFEEPDTVIISIDPNRDVTQLEEDQTV
jgi:hypothetical protein